MRPASIRVKPRLSAVDQVVLGQTIVRAGSQHCGAVSHLAMADTNRLNRPIRVDATDTIQTMGFVFDPDTLVNSLVVLAGLSDTDTAANKRGVLMRRATCPSATRPWAA